MKKKQIKPRWINNKFIKDSIKYYQYNASADLIFYREWNGYFYRYDIRLSLTNYQNSFIKKHLKNCIKDIFCKINNTQSFKNYYLCQQNMDEKNKNSAVILSKNDIECDKCHDGSKKIYTGTIIKDKFYHVNDRYTIKTLCKACEMAEYQLKKLKE